RKQAILYAMKYGEIFRLLTIFMVVSEAIERSVSISEELGDWFDLLVGDTSRGIKLLLLIQIACLNLFRAILGVFYQYIKVFLHVDLIVSDRLNKIQRRYFGLGCAEAKRNCDGASRCKQWQTIFHV